MSIVTGTKKGMSLQITKKLGYSGGFGLIRFGYTRLGFYSEYCGIYRNARTFVGKRTQKMTFYRPTNPQTVPQQAWRANMALAWSGYNALTSDEKLQLSKEARKLRLSGPQLFVKRFLLSLTA